MSIPTAGEFFFRHLLNSEPASYYAGTALADLVVAPASLSNDPGLKQLVEELRTINRDWIDVALFDSLFVGKVRDYSADAVAVRSSPQFTGTLVIFNVGLMLATHFATECYFAYIGGVDRLDPVGSESRSFFDGITRIFSTWRGAGRTVALAETLDFKQKYGMLEHDPLAIDFSVSADQFMLAHELGHHIAGHTGYATVKSEAMAIMEHYAFAVPWNRSRPDEMLADTLGIQLLIGEPKVPAQLRLDPDRLFSSLMGSLLGCTTIGLLSDAPYQDSETHPSPISRFNHSMATISLFAKMHFLLERDPTVAQRMELVRKDLVDFHDLLQRSRSKRIDT